MPQLILLNPISVTLGYRYFIFIVIWAISEILYFHLLSTLNKVKKKKKLIDYENQGESLDCYGFIDAVYNIKKLTPFPAEYTQPSNVYRSWEELFTPLCRFNYEDCLTIPNWILPKLKRNNLLASLTQLNHGQSIIYTRNISSLPMSKILILCFHCFAIKSIHLTCRFI